MKLKLMTVVGTRPELIKLSRIINECEECFEHILVHTGQNYDYELSEIFFKELGIRKPDYFLNAAGKNAAKTIAATIEKLDEILEQVTPDACLFYGDTNSCLGAIAFKRRKIPIFHMEAGNRCFDQRVPEEINRKIIDHISDINMVHSEHARRYLEREGVRPETIVKTGTPMFEVLNFYKKKVQDSKVLSDLSLKQGDFFLVSTHREENIDIEFNFNELITTLNHIAKTYNKRVIVSTHPRTRKKIEELKGFDFDTRVEFLKPLGFCDYNKLQQNAYCVISDSGTITEEASILKFPAIMIRKAHERPEGIDANVPAVMAGLEFNEVVSALELTLQLAKNNDHMRDIQDYSNPSVSKQVVRVIQSYTPYINRVVWRKGL